MEYKKIKRNLLYQNPHHERSKCKNGEIVSLAMSISKVGLIIPLVVKKLVSGSGYEIISGNRRYCACVLAGIEDIDCIVIENDMEYPVKITLEKYSQTDMFKKAETIRKALINYKSAEELAEVTGMSLNEIVDSLVLLNMTSFERDYVKTKNISEKTASRIARLSSPQIRIGRLHSLNMKKTPVRKVKLQNIRAFDNSLKKSVDILKSTGLNPTMTVSEDETEYLYEIKVEK